MKNNNFQSRNMYEIWQNAQVKESHDTEMNCQGNFEMTIRLGFIRKVYGILSIQMIITTLMCIMTISIPSYAHFQIVSPALIWLCLGGTVVIMISLCCFRELTMRVPTNYILLSLFTLCEGYIVSAICATTKPEIVLMAAIMTCTVTIALTFYAFTTKSDFTIFGSLLFVCSCVMLLFGLFLIFTHNKIVHILFSCAGVLLYSIYLVYDTQLIVGEKELSIGVDDYIYGALILYVDVISLFLHILRLLKQVSDS
jgi:FtsH-binding integral membrane protein